MKSLLTLLILGIVSASSAFAQHPIDVERLAAKGDYMKALLAYDALPDRRHTVESAIAAGRSAWALGLTKRAVEEFDKALQSDKLDPSSKARVLLSKGIIEFQEGRYPTAVLYADRAAANIAQPTPLRAKVLLLWGQALSRMNQYAQAEGKISQALEEASDEDLPEINYMLGTVQSALGKNEDARRCFERIPLEHERTSEAIRQLAVLSLQTAHFEDAIFWIEKGKKDFHDNFLDSWVDYVELQAAIGMDDIAKVRAVRAQASTEYPPSDKWLNLLDAAAEAYEWKKAGNGV